MGIGTALQFIKLMFKAMPLLMYIVGALGEYPT